MTTESLPKHYFKKPRKGQPLVQPFLKWAGGKRQLLAFIHPLIPKKINRYYEPFLGGGAVFFDQQPKKAIVNDFNAELINCYEVIRDFPSEFLKEVRVLSNTSDNFYRIREMDRTPEFASLSRIKRAARLIFLNKTCYNGLFRVNSQGQFNVPFGHYKNPVIADEAVIYAVSEYLNSGDIVFRTGDFEFALQDAANGDFVYLDPPYDPVSDTSSFTGYSLNGFHQEEQERLKKLCDALTQKNVRFLLSNSDTRFIRELYADSGYTIRTVQARRSINSIASSRGKIDEVLISNYS